MDLIVVVGKCVRIFLKAKQIIVLNQVSINQSMIHSLVTILVCNNINATNSLAKIIFSATNKVIQIGGKIKIVNSIGIKISAFNS